MSLLIFLDPVAVGTEDLEPCALGLENLTVQGLAHLGVVLPVPVAVPAHVIDLQGSGIVKPAPIATKPPEDLESPQPGGLVLLASVSRVVPISGFSLAAGPP